MTRSQRIGALLTLGVAAAIASSQVPGVPGAPPAVPGAPALPGAPAAGGAAGGGFGGAGGAAGAGGGAGGAAAPRNIWSFFLITPEQRAAHQQNSAARRARFCSSRLGQMVNTMLAPASALTGGLLGPLCPSPIGGPGGPNGAGGPGSAAMAADLAKSPTSPQGAAARIKAEEAQAKAKIEAIQFLGTVDCRYYPEAEAGLIVGLRAEKNECVRLAAAKALASGCCCTPKIIKALLISVNCTNKDGFPAEGSELVRVHAYVALERCLRKCTAAETESPPEPPAAAKQAVYETLVPFGPVADQTTSFLMVAYFAPGAMESAERVYAEAQATLNRGLKLSPQTIARMSGPRNVVDSLAPPINTSPTPGLLDRLDPRNFTRKEAPREITVADAVPQNEPTIRASREFVVTSTTPAEQGKPLQGTMVPAPAMMPATMPTTTPAGSSTTASPRPSRGSLLNIFQEARKP